MGWGGYDIQELESTIVKLKEGQKELNFYLKEEQAKVAQLESELVALSEVGRVDLGVEKYRYKDAHT